MCAAPLWMSHSAIVCPFLLQGHDGGQVMFLGALNARPMLIFLLYIQVVCVVSSASVTTIFHSLIWLF